MLTLQWSPFAFRSGLFELFTDADHPGTAEASVSSKIKVVVPNTVFIFIQPTQQNRPDLENTSQRATLLFGLDSRLSAQAVSSTLGSSLEGCALSSPACYVELSPYQHCFPEFKFILLLPCQKEYVDRIHTRPRYFCLIFGTLLPRLLHIPSPTPLKHTEHCGT